VGYGGVVALRPAITREYFGRGHFGAIFGVIMGVNALGAIAGPPIAGWCYDTWGDYRMFWLALSMLAVVAAGLVFASKRYKPELR
jgi:MFS family permease